MAALMSFSQKGRTPMPSSGKFLKLNNSWVVHGATINDNLDALDHVALI